MPESVPLKPAPPLAKRLNRNALIVAAVLGGVTALTAVVLVSRCQPGAVGRRGSQVGGRRWNPNRLVEERRTARDW